MRNRNAMCSSCGILTVIFLLLFTRIQAEECSFMLEHKIFLDPGRIETPVEIPPEIRTIKVDGYALNYEYTTYEDGLWLWTLVPDRLTSYFLNTHQYIELSLREILLEYTHTDELFAALFKEGGVNLASNQHVPAALSIRDACRRFYRGLRLWIRPYREKICEYNTVLFVILEGNEKFRIVPSQIGIRSIK